MVMISEYKEGLKREIDKYFNQIYMAVGNAIAELEEIKSYSDKDEDLKHVYEALNYLRDMQFGVF